MLLYDPGASQRSFPEPRLRDRRPAKSNASLPRSHEHLVQVPFPIGACPHFLNSFPANFSGEHRAKSVPPEADGFMADFDTALMQQVLHIPGRKRETDVQHHCQMDDFWEAF
jgi:hypothetical protein